MVQRLTGGGNASNTVQPSFVTDTPKKLSKPSAKTAKASKPKKSTFKMQGIQDLPLALTGKSSKTSNGAKPTGGAALTADDSALSSIYDGLSVPDYSGVSTSSKSLKDYIKEAGVDLGSGTNYGLLSKQVSADTKRSDTNIANMYAALQSGIRSQDPVIKSIYTDAQKSTNDAGMQAQGTINSAYDKANAQTAARLQAAGVPAGGGAITGAYADADQANAVSTSAANQQSAVQQLIGRESTARQANGERATNAGFVGAQTRADLAQQLADNLTKIKIQQSTEDADRRTKALSLAMQLQSNDASAQAAQVSAANTSFSQQLALLKAQEQEQVDSASAAQAAANEADRQDQAIAAAKAAAAKAANASNASSKSAYQRAYLQLITAGKSDADAKQILKNAGY